MSDDPTPKRLSSDRPETDPERDALGFRPLAKQLALSVANMAPEEGMVLGVYAPWGSGKSTLLNFVEWYLDEQPEESRPVVLRFNPWWFSGDEALARHFLGQLDALLASKLKSLGKAFRGKLATLAETVSAMPATKLIPVGGTNVEDLTKSLAAAAKGGAKDVVALKKEIGDKLLEKGRTVLVIVDDIDRLTPEETRQLLKLVKAVADFPRVVYLLAFDKEVVAKALASQPGVDGVGYLEKIVQVPFELPVPDEQSLGTMLFDRLNVVLRDVPQEEFDTNYWTNVFFEGIRHFLRTPRDVVRLANSLTVTFPAVVGEVNVVDFIAIESLRVFEPVLYDFVRRNPERFSGVRSLHESEADRKAFHEHWAALATPERRKHVETLISRVFPNTERTIYGPEFESRWRRARRACSRDAFPTYFRLAVPTGSISSAEIKEVLTVVGDRARFASLLREYMVREASPGAHAIGSLLGRLEDYTQEAIPDEALRPFVAALLDVSDEVAASDEGRPKGMFDFGIGVQVGRLFWQAVRRMPEAERFPFLREQFATSASLGMVLHQCVVLGQQQGKNGARRDDKDPEETWIVTSDQLAELERTVIDRTRKLSQTGALLNQKGMESLLHYWVEWSEDGAGAREWAEGAVSNVEGAARFLTHYVGESRVQALGDLNVHREKKIDLEGIAGMVDVDRLAERLRSVDLDQAEARDKEAVLLFLRTYNASKAEHL